MSQQTQGVKQSEAMVTGPQARFLAIKQELEKTAPLLQAMLPAHLQRNPDRMIRVVTSAVSRTPDLMECTARSIVLATAQACACGLEPNTPLKLGYLVPFKNKASGKKEAQFIPGYAGLIRLAIQSGEVQKIFGRVVYQKDTFQIEYGTDDRIHHVPFLDGDAGSVIGAYAVAELKNGAKQFEFMTLAQLNRIRDRSQAAKEGPWVTDEAEMQRKTPIRRLCKFLPLSEEKLLRALEHQIAAEKGTGPDFSDFIDATGELANDEGSPTNGNGEGKPAEKPSRGEALQGKLVT